jgi:hypothetical protein
MEPSPAPHESLGKDAADDRAEPGTLNRFRE